MTAMGKNAVKTGAWICLAILWGLTAAGCRSQQAPEEAAAPAEQPGPTGKVLATVDGTEVSGESLRKVLSQVGSARMEHGTLDVRSAFDQLVVARLLENEAERSGLRDDPEVRKQSEHFAYRQLAAYYVEVLRQDFIASQEIDESDLRQWEAMGTVGYDTEVILLSSLEDATGVYERLRSGESFPDLARELSMGLLASSGGSLGVRDDEYFQGMFGISMEELGLEAGQVSNPISTGVGYIIIKLRNIVQNENMEDMLDEMVKAAQVKKGAPLFDREIYPALIHDIPARYNATYLDQGVITPTVVTGKGEEMPEGIYARLGEYEISRETLTEIGAELLTPLYAGSLSGVLEKMLTEEYFHQEALNKRPDLQDDPGYLKTLVHQRGLVMRKKLVFNEVESKVEVTPSEIGKYYEVNIDQFRHGGQWDLFHILVNDPGVADQVVREFRKGTDFAKLATAYSVDSLKDKGGYVGMTRRGGLIPPLDKALEGLEAGEITPVIRTEAGYHIMKCERFLPAENRSLEEATEEITRTLWSSKVLQLLDTYQDKLRQGADIRVNEELLAEIEKEFTDAAAAMSAGHP